MVEQGASNLCAEEEAVTKLIFLNLHPILGDLLPLIKQHDSSGNAGTLLRRQCELLGTLQKRLEYCASEFPPEFFKTGLFVLLDYLTLPELVVLKRAHWNLQASSDEARINASIRRKRMKMAVHTLGYVVHKMGEKIPANKRLQIVLSSATALPSGKDIVRLETINHQSTTLENGEDVIRDIVDLLANLVRVHDKDSEGLANSLAAALDGALLARVTDSLVSFWGWSIDLQLAALKTLHVWLQLMSDPEPWQSVFPGMFASLFRRTLQLANQGETKLLDHLVALMAQLLDRCLISDRKRDQHKTLVVLESLSIPKRSCNSSAKSTFQVECQNRLPAPLLVAIRLLRTNRSAAVRLSVVHLCRVLLIRSLSPDLQVLLWETGVLLSRDSDDDVCRNAQGFVCETKDPNIDWMKRIKHLWGELRVLATSHQTVELRSHAKLLSGYFRWLSGNRSKLSQFRAALGGEVWFTMIRQVCSTLLDVQFEMSTISKNILGSVSLVTEKQSMDDGVSFRYIDADDLLSVIPMLHEFARASGRRHIIQIIDAIVADMYKGLVLRIEQKSSLVGAGQAAWLHESIGLVLLAQELVKGAFGNGFSRTLHKLAASTLPILTSSPLWTLPTSMESEATRGASAQKVVTAAALRGNVALTTRLVGLVEAIVSSMESSAQNVLPVVFYPILTKAGNTSVVTVQHASVAAIHSITTAMGLDVLHLILGNIESLLSTMMGRLRVQGGRALAISDAYSTKVLDVVSAATAVFHLAASKATNRKNEAQPSATVRSVNSCMMELVKELLARFDELMPALKSNEVGTMGFMYLFEATFAYLRNWFNTEDSPLSGDGTTENNNEPWMSLLDPFISSERATQCGHVVRLPNNGPVVMATLADTDFVSCLLSRCTYFLLHENLRVQVLCCTLLMQGFSFLGWVARNAEQDSEELNGAKTAVLRQAASLWPAISARMKDSSTTYREDFTMITTMNSSRQAASQTGHSAVFLSQALKLVSLMVESTPDDFLAQRFRDDVWPILTSILESKVGSSRLISANQDDFHRRKVRSTSSECRSTESISGVVVAALECISRVFGHSAIGLSLNDLIPPGVRLLSPLLDEKCVADHRVYHACKQTLHVLVKLDCDSIYCMLLNLNERPSLCPLTSGSVPVEDSEPASDDSGRNGLTHPELWKMVEGQPEQVLL